MTLVAEIAVAERGLEIDLTVTPGRTLALLGPNGAGKSSTLQAIAGLVEYTGAVTLAGRTLDGLEPEHRRVGYLFQDYLLFPHLSVIENVAFGPRAQGTPAAAARASAAEWLERLGVADLATRRPAELSGGQAQRVALARALCASPEALLLDEPLAALDVEVRADVREELARFLRSSDLPTVVVTHSFDDVAALADDVVVLERGRVTQRGTVRDLVREPATAYVARLVSSWSDD